MRKMAAHFQIPILKPTTTQIDWPESKVWPCSTDKKQKDMGEILRRW